MTVLDLHVHTTAFSKCSTLNPAEMIAQARAVGLTGVVITEHEKLWPAEDLARLGEGSGLLVLNGVEITTTEGDVVAYGLRQEVGKMVTPVELKAIADDQGALLVAAHPFRGFLLFGFGELDLSVDQAAARPIFQSVHGLEVCNCKVTEAENEFAAKVGAHLGLLMVGGSDAHAAAEVGLCATAFEDDITDLPGLIAALKSGRFEVRRMRT
jgi:predicted metal-dependent phosphoesterase TrpH